MRYHSPKPPEFIIETPDEREEPTEEYEIEPPDEGEEHVPEIPFEEAFEPPEFEEPFIEVESIEGFTLNDTEFLLCFTFDKFADWTGYEGWRFKTDDQGNLIDSSEKRFAGLTHRMMEKYMPDLLDQYFLEFMFCYTGIMLIGSKSKGYFNWRRRNKPDRKHVDSSIVEEPTPESDEASEIPAPEEEETPTDDVPLPPGAKTHGEDEFIKRMRRQTP